MHNRWLLLFSMSFSLSFIRSFQSENVCMFQDSCERCLSADYQCAWCSDKKYQMRYRCLTQQQLLKYGCSSKQIWENDPQMKILKDITLTDYLNDNDSAVQIRPQKVFVKLIKSHPQRLKLTYRPARNNPLDLYYLMDLTWTMRDDKATLVTMGAQLAEALRNLTMNYRLGFGSFADKPAMPMIMPHLRDNPCISELTKCEPTYSYRHHLALTEAIDDFVHSVNSSRITGNLDNLEGGFDALMQVLVCTDRIGWKTSARKIVILVTDGYMHFAGDGILAGVTRRNDKSCHLNANGEHLTSLEYDYPSLEEIYRELLKRKINIIFAVTEAVVDTYRELSGLMKEVSNVEILSTDSSNILELIKKSYESFIKRAQFFDDSPSFIRIDYETDCGGQFRTLRQRSYCNNVEMGKEVDFYINLTLIDFPKNGIYVHKVRIEESSLSEFLEFHIEIQKPCPCSEGNNLSESDEDNSGGENKGTGDIGENDEDEGRLQCSGNGNMHCGMCRCDEGWTGTFCNCPTNTLNVTTNDALEKMCRQLFTNPSEWGPVCSNRGECDCGSCFCFPGYSGKYCECPNCGIDCDLERADCVCGRCVCKEGWSGSQCRCHETNDGCIGPTGEICSERGTCECNECICKESYLGRFCEIGAESENKLCNFYESCVTCLIEEKFPNSIKSSCANLSSVCSTAEELERFTYAFVTDELDSDIRCLVRLESKDGLKCDHYFTYRSLGYSQNYLLIQANNCEAVNYYAFIGYVSSLTFLIGLVTICLVMFCVRLKDEREYARFMADQRFSTLNESPIYKNPVIEYQVPKQLIEDKNLNPFKM